MTQHQKSPAPYGGYAITSVREAGGEETPRFEAVVTLHDHKVLHVSNGGTGGSHSWQPVTGDWGAFRAALGAFEAYAIGWNAASEFAGYRDGDQLVNRLADVYELNRRRTVMFLLDDEDYWTTGVAHAFGAGVTLEQAVTHLSGPEFAGRNPRVWDKAAGDFVPVGDLAGRHREGR